MKKAPTEISVKALTLIVGRKELSLSIADARRLKDALDDIFRTRVEYAYQRPSYGPGLNFNTPMLAATMDTNFQGVKGMNNVALPQEMEKAASLSDIKAKAEVVKLKDSSLKAAVKK